MNASLQNTQHVNFFTIISLDDVKCAPVQVPLEAITLETIKTYYMDSINTFNK